MVCCVLLFKKTKCKNTREDLVISLKCYTFFNNFFSSSGVKATEKGFKPTNFIQLCMKYCGKHFKFKTKLITLAFQDAAASNEMFRIMYNPHTLYEYTVSICRAPKYTVL